MGTHPIFESDFDCLTDMDLEQILALCPAAKGALALSDLIKRALISPFICHYSSLLTHSTISSLAEGDTKRLFNVVKLFAYGTFDDYSNNRDEIGYDLDQEEKRKLKLLTLITLASQYHELDYQTVMGQLYLASHTELEELFICANASGWITGQMDQEKEKLFITTTCGRDVQPSELPEIKKLTSNWAIKTRRILAETINAQRAELEAAERSKREERQLQCEIKSVKEALRLEQENQTRGGNRPSSSSFHEHSDKKFVRKEAIDMTGENEMKPKKYKLRGRKN